MATEKAVVTQQYLTDIADAIRMKGGTTDALMPSQMAGAIEAIPSGGTDKFAEPEWLRDGSSHLWVCCDEERGKIVRLGIDVPSAASGRRQIVKWGDGEESITTTIGSVFQHEYADYGDYRIDIMPESSTATFSPTQSSSWTFLGVARTTYFGINKTWPVWAIELGENCLHTQTGNNWANIHAKQLLWLKVESSKQTFFNFNCLSNYNLKKVDLSDMTACTSMAPIALFSSCYALKEIVFPPNLETLTISPGDRIQEINLPSTLKGAIPNSILNSKSMVRRLVIPDGVESIGSYLCLNSFSLEELTIGSSVKSIGATMVNVCNNLRVIRMRPSNPPTLDSFGTFTPTAEFKIIVPVGSGEAYRNADVWSTMAQYIEEGDVSV